MPISHAKQTSKSFNHAQKKKKGQPHVHFSEGEAESRRENEFELDLESETCSGGSHVKTKHRDCSRSRFCIYRTMHT